MTPILRAFQEEYYAQYFKQWRGFLVDFPRGEALSREPRRRLASKFADENSPYNRILNVAFEQFKPWLPAAMSLEGVLADAAGEARAASVLAGEGQTDHKPVVGEGQ